MELGLDNKRGRRELARKLSGDGEGHPEWHALIARLTASYAARLAIESDENYPPAAAGGSFDRSSARIMTHYGANPDQTLAAVNPTDLARSKASDGMSVPVDGRQTPDDRG